MSTRGINNFLASFKTDVARPSRFDVNINIPYILIPFLPTSKNLTLRCEAAELPGRTFATTERKIGSAPVQKLPYQSTYNDITLTFIVGDKMDEKVFFDAWLELINPTTDYNFKYKKDYASDITINQYDVTNELSYQAILIDAFPISVNQLDLSWAADGYHKLSVVFTYTNWALGKTSDILKNIGTSVLSNLDDFGTSKVTNPKL